MNAFWCAMLGIIALFALLAGRITYTHVADSPDALWYAVLGGAGGAVCACGLVWLFIRVVGFTS